MQPSLRVFIAILFPVLAACVGAQGQDSEFRGAHVPSADLQDEPVAAAASTGVSAYWTAPAINSVNKLGTVNLPVGGQAMQAVLTPWISSTIGGVRCIAAAWNSSKTILTITYTVGTKTVHVAVQPVVTSTGLQATVSADQPVISSLEIGGWSSSLNVEPISVPYYSSQIWYAPGPSQYLNTWWDWHSTHATVFNGTYSLYQAKTDGTLNTVHEVMHVVASSKMDAVFPAIGNAASPYMSQLSKRIFFDIWGSTFLEMQLGLADLADYGIGNCAVIIHDWQNAGYDNQLPGTYPANTSLGGNAGLAAAVEQGNANGCYTGVHENYVDYYPNYPKFNAAAIGLNSDGSRILSWKNPETGIQSFSTKPSWVLPNARVESPAIHSALNTSAGYTDVDSAAAISQHGDMTAGSPGAAMLTAFTQANASLWSYERQTHGGPIFGEGLNHWVYSGLLDGVEAQLGAGNIASNRDVSLPLFVDFDLTSIHPLQVNQGMGYFERWTASGTGTMTTAQFDAYRMQEIAFGHAAFLGSAYWNYVPRAFVEANLVPPVSAAYGMAKVTSIESMLDGVWQPSSVAAPTGEFTQIQVAYNNGLNVVANSATTPLVWNGLTIPQYGWAAKGDQILAYTAECGTVICDYAQTPTSYFANARNQSDAQVGFAYAQPSVSAISVGAAHHIVITDSWKVYRTPGSAITYRMFMHFVKDSEVTASNEGIVFTGDHFPSPATTSWQAGTTVTETPYTMVIPAGVADGTYSIRVGLFNPANDIHLTMLGTADSFGRYTVGWVTIGGNGTTVSFKAEPLPTQTNDPRLNIAGSVVNFGAIQTDGMVSITQTNGQWVLRPYPRFRNFTVLIDTSVLPMPSVVDAAGGTSNSTILPVAKGSYWQLPLNGSKTYSWPIE